MHSALHPGGPRYSRADTPPPAPLPVLSRSTLPSIFLFPIFVAAAYSGTGDVPSNQRGYSLYFDQDLFVPGANEDRDYTMGLGTEVFKDQGPLYLLGDVIDTVGPLLGLDRQTGRIYQSWFFGYLYAGRYRRPATDPRRPPVCVAALPGEQTGGRR